MFQFSLGSCAAITLFVMWFKPSQSLPPITAGKSQFTERVAKDLTAPVPEVNQAHLAEPSAVASSKVGREDYFQSPALPPISQAQGLAPKPIKKLFYESQPYYPHRLSEIGPGVGVNPAQPAFGTPLYHLPSILVLVPYQHQYVELPFRPPGYSPLAAPAVRTGRESHFTNFISPQNRPKYDEEQIRGSKNKDIPSLSILGDKKASEMHGDHGYSNHATIFKKSSPVAQRILPADLFALLPRDIYSTILPLVHGKQVKKTSNIKDSAKYTDSLELAKKFDFYKYHQSYDRHEETSIRDVIQEVVEFGTLVRDSISNSEGIRIYSETLERRISDSIKTDNEIGGQKLFWSSIFLSYASEKNYKCFKRYQGLIEIMKWYKAPNYDELAQDFMNIDSLAEQTKKMNPRIQEWIEDQAQSLKVIFGLILNENGYQQVNILLPLVETLLSPGAKTDFSRIEIYNAFENIMEPVSEIYHEYKTYGKKTGYFPRAEFSKNPEIKVRMKRWKMDMDQIERIAAHYIPWKSKSKTNQQLRSQELERISNFLSKQIDYYINFLGNGEKIDGIQKMLQIYNIDHLEIQEGSEGFFDLDFKERYKLLSIWNQKGRPIPRLIHLQ